MRLPGSKKAIAGRLDLVASGKQGTEMGWDGKRKEAKGMDGWGGIGQHALGWMDWMVRKGCDADGAGSDGTA